MLAYWQQAIVQRETIGAWTLEELLIAMLVYMVMIGILWSAHRRLAVR